jgi:hypothetical protein
MGEIDNGAGEFEFPQNTYVLLISLFARVGALYPDLLDILAWLHVIKSASAVVMSIV